MPALTVVNAAVQPTVSRYLGQIETRLRDDGVAAELLVMQSNGGVYTFKAARERPGFMVESGPAAGVIAAAHFGATLGHPNVISLDMGGTTAKAGLVRDGQPGIAREYEVGATARAGVGAWRGGYPIRTPVVDLVEIGAGGGSIAWIDSGGALRVGPRSAGADPGPACYGLGGAEPTVTDANLVLGRLNPGYFVGGEIELDVGLARRAIQGHCANPLGLDVTRAAHGIVEIANAAMADAIRLISVQRGFDPREFVLIAFGGAGPAHASRLAAEHAIPITVVPMSPGTTSALGLLVTDLRHEYASTLIGRLDRLRPADVEAAFERMTGDGLAALERDGVAQLDVALERQADLRYVGQSYELTLSIEHRPFDAAALTALSALFHVQHDRAYGYCTPSEPVELVNLRLAAVGRIPKPRLREIAPGPDTRAAIKERRPVYFGEPGEFVETSIYDRYRLGAGGAIDGPAVVEEMDSTTVIHPGYRANVDRWGNLLLERAP